MVFISKNLEPGEIRYSKVEKECLAVVRAVTSLKYYFLGQEFIIERDHKAVKWMDRIRDSNS